jgi:hypothetical protein
MRVVRGASDDATNARLALLPFNAVKSIGLA